MDTLTFGVGFRNSVAGGKGTVSVEGSVRAPGFSKPTSPGGVFFYKGLTG